METTTLSRHPGEQAVYELFDIKTERKAREDAAERTAHLKAKRDLAHKLGLTYQVSLLEREIKDVNTVSLDMPAMTEDEIAIWRAFLPMTYTTSQNDAFALRGYEHTHRYQFDMIPHPVLEKWAFYKDHNVFEQYEVWTPEAVRERDPILIGVIGNKRYLLARWAESDANFVTMGDIKRKLIKRWFVKDGPLATLLGFTLFVLAAVAIVAMFVATRDTYVTRATTLLQWVGPICAGIWGGMTWFNARNNDLMNAIRRHSLAN